MAEGPNRELRLALAMRGGVSLAVWMGGACREINALRLALTDEQVPTGEDTLYAELLRVAGYDRVSVDVVAGASAGGLNGVLMGCSVVHGMAFGRGIRNLWLRLGDIGKLSRDLAWKLELSPLDGDRAFYGELAKVLSHLVKDATRPAKAPRLDLSLTGTLLYGRETHRFQDVGGPITEVRSAARFRFRHLPVPETVEHGLLTDFGHAGEERDEALRKLAYAARSTSSFPGAFEPASVGYAAGSAMPEDREQHECRIPTTHHGVFSESRPGDGTDARDLVIDGGVLDNIPVAWAVRTIAAAPADHEVDRWLAYLQPLPFGRRVRNPPRLTLKETISRARSIRSSTETLTADIDELDQLRRAAMARGGFAQVLEYALGQVPDGVDQGEFLDQLYDRAAASLAAYRKHLGNIERERVRRLWTDPMPVLGVDPLGFHGVDRANADVPEGASHDRLVHELTSLANQYDGVLPDGLPQDNRARLLAAAERFRTPQVHARTVALILETARSLEDQGHALKGKVYELRSRIELLVACHDRYLAAEIAADGQAGALDRVRRAAQRLDGQSQEGAPEWRPEHDVEPVPPEWPTHRLAGIFAELVSLAMELAKLLPDDSTTRDRKNRRRPDLHPGYRGLLRCLLMAADDAKDPAGAAAAVLVAVELLTGPLRTDPLGEWSGLRFHMVTADRVSAVPNLADLDVNAKLAGNQIQNFGAFLSARWRLNDWTWGRMDAAASLVDIITADADHDDALLDKLRPYGGAQAAVANKDEALIAVRTALVRRLQEAILRDELPWFDVVGREPPSEAALEQQLEPASTLDVTPLREVGEQDVKNLVRAELSMVPGLGKVAAVFGLGLSRGIGDKFKRLFD